MHPTTETRHASESNPYFSPDYRTARQRFLETVKKCCNFSFHDELKLDVKGPDGKDLFIDLVWLGPIDADKILIHISATHGVEGHVGAAGQLSLVHSPETMPKDTACIMIFGMNSFGYSWNRRVNESNVDLNRNLRDERSSPELYKYIDSLMNPKKIINLEEFLKGFDEAKKKHDWLPIKSALAEGQHDYPEGMFYGGKEVEQGPELVLSWFEKHFSTRKDGDSLRFLIIDVHTGLGDKRGLDTLLTPIKPPQSVIEFFGSPMKAGVQKETMGGYKPLGMFTVALAQNIERVTKCSLPIFRIGQEFGTVPVQQVLLALWAENMHWHAALRAGKTPDPYGSASLQLRKVFSLDDKESQDKAICRMRELFQTSLDYLQKAHLLRE